MIFDTLPHHSHPHSHRRILAWVVLLHAAVLLAVAWFFHAIHFSLSFDSAINLQRLWMLSHGSLDYSILPGTVFSDHSLFSTLVFLPLFMLFPAYGAMMLAQTVLISVSVIPVYLLAKERLGEKWALGIAISYIMHPALAFGAISEFHPEILCVPLLGWSLLFFAREDWKKFMLVCLAIVFCKENMAGVIFCYGILAAFNKRKWSWIVAPAALGLGWMCLHFFVFSPFFNPGQGIDFWTYIYGHLGQGPAEIIPFILRHPIEALQRSIPLERALALTGKLFLPVLFVALLRPAYLIPAGAIFMQHVFSQRHMEHVIYYHYYAPVVPFLYAACISCLQSLKSRLLPDDQFQGVVGGIYAVLGVACFLFYGPVQKAAALYPGPLESPNAAFRQNALRMIPAADSVCADVDDLKYTALREKIFFLDNYIEGTYSYSSIEIDDVNKLQWVTINFNRIQTVPDTPFTQRLLKGDWRIHRAWENWLLLGRFGKGPPPVRVLPLTRTMGKRPLMTAGDKLALLKGEWRPLMEQGQLFADIRLVWVRLKENFPLPGMQIEVLTHKDRLSQAYTHKAGYGLAALQPKEYVFEEYVRIPLPQEGNPHVRIRLDKRLFVDIPQKKNKPSTHPQGL